MITVQELIDELLKVEDKSKKEMKEIRIKYDDNVSDELASQLVWSVINQGKISNEGKSYCYATVFKVDGTEYQVVVNNKTKSTMFYINKKD